jgi:predicted small secreted protein
MHRSRHALQTRTDADRFARKPERVTVNTPSKSARTANPFRGHWPVMNSLQKRTLLGLLLAALGTFVFSGCNTMSGVGKDVERAGEKIQQNAK